MRHCLCKRPIGHAYAQKCDRCIQAKMDEARPMPKAVIAPGGRITLQRPA